MTIDVERGGLIARLVRERFKTLIVGLDRAIETVTVGMFTPGDIRHVMFEGVPGVGKTLLAEVAARIVAGKYQRLTGKADDMPEALLGWWSYVPGTDKRIYKPGSLTRQPWEVLKAHYGAETLQNTVELSSLEGLDGFDSVVKKFYVILLYDEVNRSNEQVLGAMLEYLQEGKVTAEGISIPMNPANMVIFTRNPFDLRQTFDPPAAFWGRIALQDNFLVPNLTELREIIHNASNLAYQRKALALVEPVLTVDEVLEVRGYIDREVRVAPPMENYLARLIKGTEQGFLRDTLGVARIPLPGGEALDLKAERIIKADSEGQGGGTGRLAITLTMLAKTAAYLSKDGPPYFVRPSDVKKIFHRAIMHQIFLEKRTYGQTKGSIVARAIADTLLEVVDEPNLGDLR